MKFLNAIRGAVLLQARLILSTPETLFPVLTVPLLSIVSMAIFIHGGRPDLVGFSIIASVVMTVGQMGFFVGSEIVAAERRNGILEVALGTPANYTPQLVARVFVLSLAGCTGFLASWTIAWLIFHVAVPIAHPAVFVAAMLATCLSTAFASLLTGAVFCFGRTARTLQNAIAAPLYLFGGALVPLAYLPPWMQDAGRAIYLSWAADLMRDAMQSGPVESVSYRLTLVLFLGGALGTFGCVLLGVMLRNLRAKGSLGLG